MVDDQNKKILFPFRESQLLLTGISDRILLSSLPRLLPHSLICTTTMIPTFRLSQGRLLGTVLVAGQLDGRSRWIKDTADRRSRVLKTRSVCVSDRQTVDSATGTCTGTGHMFA